MSYYQQIQGIKYARDLLDMARAATEGGASITLEQLQSIHRRHWMDTELPIPNAGLCCT
jgi:hypothetical protein